MADLIQTNFSFKDDKYPETVRQKIAGVLCLEDINALKINDARPEEGLYLVGPNDNVSYDDYGWLRGIVVDINSEKVVCESYGYIPSVVTDVLKLNDDKSLTLIDINGNKHHVEKDSWVIEQHHDAVTVRVFKHKGKVYYSTMSRLDFTRSKWGWMDGKESKMFGDMWSELNGPKAEELFQSSDSSPFVYLFLLAHPDILNVYRGNIKEGYIGYIGYKNMSSDNLCVLLEKNEFMWSCGWSQGLIEQGKKHFMPKPLTLDETNQYLRFGAYRTWADDLVDPRLKTGESVVVYTPDGIIHVRSHAYDWRTQIRQENPNLGMQFYALQHDLKLADKDFLNKYPTLQVYHINSIITTLSKDNLTVWPNTTYLDPLTHISEPEGKMYQIWASMLMAVPIHMQKIVSKYLDNHIADKEELLNYIYNIHISGRYIDPQSERRLLKLVQEARNIAQERTENENDDDKFDKMVKIQIKILLNKEYPNSLYRLIRDMNKTKKYEAKFNN